MRKNLVGIFGVGLLFAMVAQDMPKMKACDNNQNNLRYTTGFNFAFGAS